jgi:OOP family OmpA-OmpF porin
MGRFHRLIPFCLLSLLTVTAYAGNRPNSFTLSAGGGNIFFAPKRNVNNTGFGFAGAGYNFTYNWGIDGIIGFFTTRSNNNTANNEQVNGTLFAIDALYRFPAFHHFEAYALAGPGVMGLSPSGNNDPNTEGNINAGLGVQYFIDYSFAFKIEARDFYTITGGKNDVLLDAGISYAFGC